MSFRKAELGEQALELFVLTLEEAAAFGAVQVIGLPAALLDFAQPFVRLHDFGDCRIPVSDLCGAQPPGPDDAAPVREHGVDALLLPRGHVTERTPEALR